MLYRKIETAIYQHLSGNSDKVLIVSGARQIGKSFIIRYVGSKLYKNFVEINLINDFEGPKIFEKVKTPDEFYFALGIVAGKHLGNASDTLVFLDEIQKYPHLLTMLKFLREERRYRYVASGSLLGVTLKRTTSIPIGSIDILKMYPLDFEEFLWAIGKEPTFDLIRYSYQKLKPLGDAVNRDLMKLFRLYMLVGGMPQAVATYLHSSDFETVDDIKRDIIKLYLDDFEKVDDKGRASVIFKSIPAELARNTMRYRVGSVIENARFSRLEEIFNDIDKSKTVNFAYHANDPSVGFALHASYDFFKMFISDTGLFVTLAFMDKDFTENIIYKKLLTDKLSADLGYIYENVVAQLLRASGHALYYYTFKEKDPDISEPRSYEIDFLISRQDKICPIEVKSSGYKSHKSLDEFQRKFSSRIRQRYLLYTKDLRKEEDIICLPVYMAGLL